ncbi:MAG: peptide chain release factor 1 [Actinobacteria bacterium]|nr:peptide chain release factor 1 [Actinomycetota bacterium]|tara:strand:- start:3446 stop:4525 length:1080 start_codon:yes stop_codon:yes gene_type:complete
MKEQISNLEKELGEAEKQLSDPDVIGDPSLLAKAGKRLKELGDILEVGRPLKSMYDDLEAAKELLEIADDEDKQQLRQEVEDLESSIPDLEEQLRLLLLPKDPNDGRNVILEIRGAEGGEEANLFARDLHDMYLGFANLHKWKVESLGTQESDMGGYSEVAILISGETAWTRLKHEGGVHRVQRVPVTESQGRVHTSSATVSVLPEAEEVDIEISDNELQVDVYRSSGPGGQSVNTTDSAVRITHLPTGLVVSMQDEKSQLQNKAKALRVLRSRLLQNEQDKQQAEASAARKGQVGMGGRSEKIRTYNFKENRVTDHRIGLTLHKLERILTGELDEVVDELLTTERSEQLMEKSETDSS